MKLFIPILFPLEEENEDFACASSPCVHGICSAAGNGFECLCYDDFIGTLCDERKLDSILIVKKYNMSILYCQYYFYAHPANNHVGLNYALFNARLSK